MESLIVERDPCGYEFPVLQLSKKGFQSLKSDFGELLEERYSAQAVAHDYLATAFQLGEFLGNPQNISFLTEQELQVTDESLLPDWAPKSRSHIPGGLTYLDNGKTNSTFAIEVELNLKPLVRYDKAAYFFDGGISKIDVVFWLCDGNSIAENIFKRLQSLRIRNFDIHHFVWLEDFRKIGWGAIARSGQFKNKTLREIYQARCAHMAATGPPPGGHRLMNEIFFPISKCPWRTKAYAISK